MDNLVSYQLADGIASIRMDDGKANVMSVRMLGELSDAFDRAAADKAVVLLSGRERMFSGGFDLAVFKRDREELCRMLEAGARLSEKMVSFPRPIVAACTGHAVAMGVFLLLGADLRIGPEEGARFHVNEVAIGLALPKFAVEMCRLRLAPAHLHHAAGLAEPYNPQQALAAGFLNELAASGSIEATARTRAAGFAKLHPEAFAETKLRLTRNAREAISTAVREDIADWARMFGRAA